MVFAVHSFCGITQTILMKWIQSWISTQSRWTTRLLVLDCLLYMIPHRARLSSIVQSDGIDCYLPVKFSQERARSAKAICFANHVCRIMCLYPKNAHSVKRPNRAFCSKSSLDPFLDSRTLHVQQSMTRFRTVKCAGREGDWSVCPLIFQKTCVMHFDGPSQI